MATEPCSFLFPFPVEFLDFLLAYVADFLHRRDNLLIFLSYPAAEGYPLPEPALSRTNEL